MHTRVADVGTWLLPTGRWYWCGCSNTTSPGSEPHRCGWSPPTSQHPTSGDAVPGLSPSGPPAVPQLPSHSPAATRDVSQGPGWPSPFRLLPAPFPGKTLPPSPGGSHLLAGAELSWVPCRLHSLTPPPPAQKGLPPPSAPTELCPRRQPHVYVKILKWNEMKRSVPGSRWLHFKRSRSHKWLAATELDGENILPARGCPAEGAPRGCWAPRPALGGAPLGPWHTRGDLNLHATVVYPSLSASRKAEFLEASGDNIQDNVLSASVSWTPSKCFSRVTSFNLCEEGVTGLSGGEGSQGRRR